PTFDQDGDYTVTFRLADPSGASDTIQVPIHIDNVNRPPTLAVSDHQVVINHTLSFTVPAHDPDSEDTLAYCPQNLPEQATLDSHPGLFQWTPCPGQLGEYVVTVGVFDGQVTALQNVRLRVLAAPELPAVTVELTPSFPATPGLAVQLHVA